MASHEVVKCNELNLKAVMGSLNFYFLQQFHFTDAIRPATLATTEIIHILQMKALKYLGASLSLSIEPREHRSIRLISHFKPLINEPSRCAISNFPETFEFQQKLQINVTSRIRFCFENEEGRNGICTKTVELFGVRNFLHSTCCASALYINTLQCWKT